MIGHVEYQSQVAIGGERVETRSGPDFFDQFGKLRRVRVAKIAVKPMSHRSNLLQRHCYFNPLRDEFSTGSVRLALVLVLPALLGLSGCSVQTQYSGDLSWQYQHSSERAAEH